VIARDRGPHIEIYSHCPARARAGVVVDPIGAKPTRAHGLPARVGKSNSIPPGPPRAIRVAHRIPPLVHIAQIHVSYHRLAGINRIILRVELGPIGNRVPSAATIRADLQPVVAVVAGSRIQSRFYAA